MVINSGDPVSIIIWVIQHESGLMLNNIPKEYSAYFNSLDSSFLPFPVFSGLCLPYVYEQHRGVIVIYSRKRDTFNDEDWHFMEMLTSKEARLMAEKIRDNIEVVPLSEKRIIICIYLKKRGKTG